jgi:hypothetical protein
VAKAGPWKPAKTTKEAQERAVKEGWIAAADFGAMHVDAANQYMDGLTQHLTDFPALKGVLSYTGTNSGWAKHEYARQAKEVAQKLLAKNPTITPEQLAFNLKYHVRKLSFPRKAWALAWGSPNGSQPRAVTFNESFSKSLEDKMGSNGKPLDYGSRTLLKQNVASKFHPVACDTHKSVMDHELGHQLDNLLNLRNHPDVQALRWEAYGGKPGGHVDPSKREPGENVFHGGVRVHPTASKAMVENVSKYAAENIKEFIAEAWAEYRNNPNPRPIAQRMGKIVETEYAKQFGKKA